MTDRLVWTPADLNAGVAARFELIASRYADRTALDLAEGQLSYRQLHAEAQQLAAGLAARLGRSKLVALLLEPGADFFSAFLGVVQSGNICLPLGMHNPDERLAAIVEMARPDLAVAGPAGAQRLRPLGSMLDILDPAAIRTPPDLNWRPAQMDPQAPAAVYLTSGSTGEPKGVVRDQQNLVHHAMVYSQDSALGPADRQSFLYSPQSGASMPDLLGALLNGAALVPYDPVQYGAKSFADWMASRRLTILHMPVPLYRLWLESVGPETSWPELRLILVGGEAVFRADIERGRRLLGAHMHFIHQLASTETNYIARFPIDGGTKLESEVLPVGRPAADKVVELLDEQRRPVETGQVGEIVVRSRYLAGGYWRDPALTALRFLPAHDDPAAFVYATGDLGRFDDSGVLHYLGRKDRRVRIRSHRVDLPIVEAALYDLGLARLAAVEAWPDRGGGNSLVAYLAAVHPGSTPQLDTLRLRLAEHLPAHMLPSSLVVLDRMPLLASGKIDHQALPAPGSERPQMQTPYLAPRDPFESRLANLWERVLEVGPIGVRDPFFGLGGTSLQAMRLVAAISDQFGEELPQSILLQAPTIEQQALLLKTEQPARPTRRILGLQVSGKKPPLFCISPRVVNVIAYHHLALALGPDQPVYALYPVLLPPRSAECSWVKHEAEVLLAEMMAVQPHGPYRLIGYSGGGVVALEMAQRVRRSGQSVELVVLLDCYGPSYRRTVPWIPQRLYRPLQLVRRLQQSADEFWPRLREHWRELRKLTPAEGRRYMTTKAAGHLRWQFSRLRRQLRRIENGDRGRSPQAKLVGRSFADYEPEPYPDRVALYRAEHQPLGIVADPFMGWRETLTGDVEVCQIPGYHDSVLAATRIDALAAVLQATLQQVKHDSPAPAREQA